MIDGISLCIWFSTLNLYISSHPEILVSLSVFCCTRYCIPFRSTCYRFQYFVVPGTTTPSGSPGIAFSILQYQELLTLPEHLVSVVVVCGTMNCLPSWSTWYSFQYFVITGTAHPSRAPCITFSILQCEELLAIPEHPVSLSVICSTRNYLPFRIICGHPCFLVGLVLFNRKLFVQCLSFFDVRLLSILQIFSSCFFLVYCFICIYLQWCYINLPIGFLLMVTLLFDLISNKMKNAKYHIIGTVPKFNKTNRRKRQKTIHQTYIRCKMSSLLMRKYV